MSGESVGELVVGMAGVMAMMGAAAGASCAFVVGGSLTALGRQLEHQEAQRAASRAERERWERALQDVAVRNARIGALAAAGAGQRAAPGGPALPAPLVLGTQDLAELAQWCAQADAVLQAAERAAVDRCADALLRRASSAPGRLTTAADVLGTDATASAWEREPLLADMRRIVVRLAVAADEAERDGVARAAERVVSAPSRIEARNRLDDLRVRVDRANAAAEARRQQAVEAAGLLQPLAQAGAAAEPLREALDEVVAGRRALTPDLAEQARQAAADLQQAASKVYVRHSIEAALAELGYSVAEGFQTAVPVNGALQVSRSDWTAHGVRMILDSDKQELRAVVVRTATDGSWDEDRVDAEREAQWCGTLLKLEASLAEKGIAYDVRSLTAPGARPVPVVQGAPQQQAPAARQAEIGRQPGHR